VPLAVQKHDATLFQDANYLVITRQVSRRGNKPKKLYIQWYGVGQAPSNLTSVIHRPVVQVLVAVAKR
jgi:hypothetical protein